MGVSDESGRRWAGISFRLRAPALRMGALASRRALSGGANEMRSAAQVEECLHAEIIDSLSVVHIESISNNRKSSPNKIQPE